MKANVAFGLTESGGLCLKVVFQEQPQSKKGMGL